MPSWGKYEPRPSAETKRGISFGRPNSKRPSGNTRKRRISAPGQAIDDISAIIIPDPRARGSPGGISAQPRGKFTPAGTRIATCTHGDIRACSMQTMQAKGAAFSLYGRHNILWCLARDPGPDTTRYWYHAWPGKTPLQAERTHGLGYTSGPPDPGRRPLSSSKKAKEKPKTLMGARTP